MRVKACVMAGNDLTEDITPIEAGLKWTIGKSRRDKCDFLGGEVGLILCYSSIIEPLCKIHYIV